MLRQSRPPRLFRPHARQNPSPCRGEASRRLFSLLGDTQYYTLDGRCCRFLGVPYAEIKERTLQGGSDEDILAWVHARGTVRSDEECHMWNRFIAKLGWRDERSHLLPQRIQDCGLTGKPIETIIDHIEYDEGRDPVTERAWEGI